MSHFITIFSGKVIFSLPLRFLSTFKKHTPGLFNPKVRMDWFSGQRYALGLPPHLSPTEIKPKKGFLTYFQWDRREVGLLAKPMCSLRSECLPVCHGS